MSFLYPTVTGIAFRLVGLLLLLSAAFAPRAAAGAEKPNPPENARASGTLPARALRFRPWGCEQTFRLILQEVKPLGSQPASPPKTDAAAGIWKPWFDDAILFVTEHGQRLVTTGKQPQGTSVDYVEIRPTGTGFGVNTDNYSSRSHLYLDQFRLVRPARGASGPVRVEFVATMNYTGAVRKPNDAARLVFTANPVGEDLAAVGGDTPDKTSIAVQASADPPTTLTVSDASETSAARRSFRRQRR